jgi:hypothetical protein
MNRYGGEISRSNRSGLDVIGVLSGVRRNLRAGDARPYVKHPE